MAGDELEIQVNQYRDIEAERLDAARDLPNLARAVNPWIVRVEFQLADGPIHDRDPPWRIFWAVPGALALIHVVNQAPLSHFNGPKRHPLQTQLSCISWPRTVILSKMEPNILDGKLAAKCDRRLDWWLRLANLHRLVLPTVSDPVAGKAGFSSQVGELGGPRPEGVDALFRRGDQPLIGAGIDPDRYLWGLAGVADSVLSKISELGDAREFSTKVVIADWSTFAAPLILAVSQAGEVVEAYRPEPLGNDLLSIIKGRNVCNLGTCPVCKRLFERMRKDQKCDSRHCRDAYRQRRHRAERRRYESNRRRYRKEGIKAKELTSFSAGLRQASMPQRDSFLEMVPPLDEATTPSRNVGQPFEARLPDRTK